MNFSVTVKKKLFEMIDEMNAYAWLFVQNPLKDFSREKKWSFGNTLKFMISMEGKSMRDDWHHQLLLLQANLSERSEGLLHR